MLGHFKSREYEKWANRNLTYNEMRVYNALICYLDWKTGTCFPSYEHLVRDTGIKHKDQFRKVTNLLAEKGLVKKWRHGVHNCYQILNYKGKKIVPPSVKQQKYLTEQQVEKLVGKYLEGRNYG